MRTRQELARVRALARDGFSQNAIARETGIPTTTVNRWLNGRPPRFGRPGGLSCPACGHHVHDTLDGAAYSYILGLYLGDGHLVAFPRTECLRIYLDARYPDIIRACAEAIRVLLPRNRVSFVQRKGCVTVQSYSRQWGCLLPQHGPGPKHDRAIALVEWQQLITGAHPRELIRGLLHSDGCRFDNVVSGRSRRYAYPSYAFSNRSEDIKRILCDHLDLLGIAWRRVGDRQISIARREAVAALDAFVGPKR